MKIKKIDKKIRLWKIAQDVNNKTHNKEEFEKYCLHVESYPGKSESINSLLLYLKYSDCPKYAAIIEVKPKESDVKPKENEETMKQNQKQKEEEKQPQQKQKQEEEDRLLCQKLTEQETNKNKQANEYEVNNNMLKNKKN